MAAQRAGPANNLAGPYSSVFVAYLQQSCRTLLQPIMFYVYDVLCIPVSHSVCFCIWKPSYGPKQGWRTSILGISAETHQNSKAVEMWKYHSCS